MIDISLTDDWSKEESLLVKNILIGALDNLENQDNDEISVLLTNDYEIRKLNKKYRNVNKTTNVLSFPMNNKINNLGNKMLGDIVISKDTLLKESKEKKKDLNACIAHMIVHGLLHLKGYEHQEKADAEIMENREIMILKRLGFANPYL